MDMNKIGSRLDEAMKDAKIQSQSQLARMSGVPQPTVNRILKGRGKQGPETVTLVALAEATGVELRWLQQGIGPKHIAKNVREERREEEEVNSMPHSLRVVESPPATMLQWVSEREAELLSEYRACAEPQRERLLVVARSLPKDLASDAGREKA